MKTIRGPVAAALLCVAAWVPTQAQAQAQWVPNEARVSPTRGLIDFEVSQQRAKIAWTDPNGVLWLAGINRTTGAFEPDTGRGQQIATNTVAGWNMFMWNGPEWLAMASGDQIHFSYYLPDRPKTAANARMAMAVADSTGAWVVKPIDSGGQPRMTHVTSRDKGDAQPHIKYLDPALNAYWRDVLVPGSEQKLSFLPPSNKAWRFASGMRALLYTQTIGGVAQVFRYALDSKVHEQLTFDGGGKDANRTVPWQFRAPEFGNDPVLTTVVDGSELRVYRQFGGVGAFVPVHSVTLPDGRTAGSPEWFTYNGKSYVFFVAYASGAEYPAEVWLSAIDPARPLFRRITDDSLLRARNDPEVFVTTQLGPLIYYNRYDPSLDPAHPLCADCSEGVFRADPGLLGR